MTVNHVLIALLLMGTAGNVGAAEWNHQQPSTPTTAAAEVTPCAHAQIVVDDLLENAMARIEAARQANAASELRAAVDDLQSTLREVRAQLAACATPQAPPDPHAGHVMPSQPPAPSAPATSASTTKPSVTMPGPTTAATTKPAPAIDPHAAHTPSATKSTSAAKPGATAKPASAARAPSAARAAPSDEKPAASDPHAGHTAATAKPSAAASKPPPAKKAAPAAPPAATPDPHAGHAAGAPSETTTESATAAKTLAVDPVCGLKVDPASAPSARHQDQTYHFCSEQHRQLFQKNPAKYLPRGR